MNTATETAGSFETANGQQFVPGVQGFTTLPEPRQQDVNAVSPNAIRWLFNPFAHVDISNRPVSGHRTLYPGVFIPIVNQINRVSLGGISSSPGKAFEWNNGGAPIETGVATPGNPSGRYANETRTAYAIASEIEDAYSERGVRVLPSLTKFDDMAAVQAIHETFIAPGLEYNADPYQSEFPVPNLIRLEAYLSGMATREASKLTDQNMLVQPKDVISDVLVAVRTAIQECRNVTRDAKRHVGNRTQGYSHSFDAYHTRCFIALGEPVPSDIPVEMQQRSGMAHTAPDTDELSKLRAENAQLRADAAERENAALRAELEAMRANSYAKPPNGAVIAEPEKIAVRCDFIKANGEQCKATTGIDENGRCRSHPIEILTEGESINGREGNESGNTGGE